MNDTETSNNSLARLTGLLYLILLPTVGMAYGSTLLIMQGNGDATLANLLENRGFFQISVVLGAIGFVDFLFLGLAARKLFAHVSKDAANLMLGLVAVSVPVSLIAIAARMDVLLLMDGAAGLPPAGSEQVTQVMLALHSSNNLILVSAIFWGLWLLPLGWLVIRCDFMPRVIGYMLMLGAIFYGLAFAGPVLVSNYDDTLLSDIVGYATGIPSIAGEFATALWLLVFGTRRRTVPAGNE